MKKRIQSCINIQDRIFTYIYINTFCLMIYKKQTFISSAKANENDDSLFFSPCFSGQRILDTLDTRSRISRIVGDMNYAGLLGLSFQFIKGLNPLCGCNLNFII